MCPLESILDLKKYIKDVMTTIPQEQKVLIKVVGNALTGGSISTLVQSFLLRD